MGSVSWTLLRAAHKLLLYRYKALAELNCGVFQVFAFTASSYYMFPPVFNLGLHLPVLYIQCASKTFTGEEVDFFSSCMFLAPFVRITDIHSMSNQSHSQAYPEN